MSTAAESPLPVKGVRLAAGAAALRYQNRDDLAVIEVAGERAVTAAVFTRNRFVAAPVIAAREHLQKCTPRYLLINAGYANAGLGEQGLEDARSCCQGLAELTQARACEVIPFSTGVIGERLPVQPLITALPELLTHLSSDGWGSVARAIMTTDTVPKHASFRLEYPQGQVTITGIAKGAGMICPNMATMLGFIATDVMMDKAAAKRLLSAACDVSFNCITVDGDTSTNDACVLIASGGSGVAFADLNDAEQQRFADSLNEVTGSLAEKIIRDAEGARHFVTIDVQEAPTVSAAQSIAKTVANSPLVKTALAGGDPNWGRVLAAIGRAEVEVPLERLAVYFGKHCVFKEGALDPDYTEEKGLQATSRHDVEIRIVLGNGQARSRVLTSDLTAEYVEINTQYRS